MPALSIRRTPSSITPSDAPRPTSQMLIGRERELADLCAGLGDALDSRGRLFLLVGEPGAGKTRLAEELAAKATQHGCCVLWGRAWDGAGAPPFWPWIQILRSHLRAADRERLRVQIGSRAAELARLIPDLAAYAEVDNVTISAPSPISADDGDAARFRLMDATTGFLRATTPDQPLVLILDDLQAADPATLRLLLFLARDLRDTRLLVVANYRAAEGRVHPDVAEVLADISREGTTIELLPLSFESVADLVEQLSGPQPSDVLEAIFQATGGNPFFARQVAHGMRTEQRNAYPLTVADVQRMAPKHARDAVQLSLRPLSELTRTVLSIAAVAGREFEISTVERVVGGFDIDAGRFSEALFAAFEAGILNAGGDTTTRRFAHDLLREALYAGLDSRVRAALHGRLAEAIESAAGNSARPRIAEITYHLYAAANDAATVDRAIRYGKAAGQHALSCLAYEDAREHFEKAADWIERWHGNRDADSARLHSEALLALAAAHRLCGDGAQALQACRRAAQIAQSIGAADLFTYAVTQSDANPMAATEASQVGQIEEALRLLGPQDGAPRARCLAALAAALYGSAESSRCEALSREAVAMARRLGDDDTLSYALFQRELALWVPECAEERSATADEHLQLAERIGDLKLARHAHGWRLLGALERGDMETFDRAAESFREINDKFREPHYRYVAALWQPLRSLLLGCIDDAERSASEALSLGLTANRDAARAAYSLQLLLIRHQQGRLAELIPMLEATLWESAHPTYELRATLAFVYAEMGRRADASRLFEQLAADRFSAAPHDFNWLPTMALLASTCARLGDQRRAAILCELLSPFASRIVVAGMAAACWGAMARYLGVLHAQLGDWQVAAEQFEAATVLHEKMQAPPLRALTQCDYAEMLIRRAIDEPRRQNEVRHRACELLGSAAATAQALGMSQVFLNRIAALRHDNGERRSTLDGGGTAVRSMAPSSTFRREGDVWMVTYADETHRFRGAKGFALIAYLLQHPGREIHAIDLEAVDSAGPRIQSEVEESLDPEAKAAYRRRLRELHTEIHEAESFNDSGRVERLRHEVEFITEELTRAVGLGGRERRTGSASERARVNVKRSIGLALRRIAAQHPALAEHLNRTLRTGTFCEYAPDPRLPIEWQVQV